MTDELITEFSSLVDRIMAMHSATAGLDYLVRSELVWSLRKMRTDEESRWLHHTATELCRDPASVKRQIGCDLLSMSNDLSPEQQQEAVRVLISLLDDPDGRVLEAAIHALRNNDAARPEMLNRLELAHHHSFEVRLALAWAIGESHPPPPVVRTLVAMSMDENERVRDWATFELGSVCEVDTLEIREALHERLHDTDFDTRSEALKGLAVRGDLRVLEPLIDALNDNYVGMMAVEAAGDLAHPALITSLEALLPWWDVDTELLQDSLTKCRERTLS